MAVSMPLITAEGIKWVKPPSLRIPIRACRRPATDTDRKNISMAPSSVMAAAQMAVRPAAGPLTLRSDLLMRVMTMPPMTPANKPEYTGAPEARDTPRHSGRATKKTVMLALKSCLVNDNQ